MPIDSNVNDGFLPLIGVPDLGISTVQLKADSADNGTNPIELNVIEDTSFIDGSEGFHNPSAAGCTISQVKVDAGTIRTLVVDYRPTRENLDADSDKYITGSGNSTANQWQSLGTVNVEWDVGTTAYTNSTTFAGIPTQEGQTKNYEFRASFLNGGNIPGKLGNPYNVITSGTSYDFSKKKGNVVTSWSQGTKLWAATFEADYNSDINTKIPFIQDSLTGRVVRFYDNTANDTDEDTGFLFEGVCYSNKEIVTGKQTLMFYFPENPRDGATGYNSGTVSPVKMSIPNSDFVYEVGISGFGTPFNGVNDLKEYVEVSGLYGQLDGTNYRLEWHNMYDAPSVVGQTSVDASGDAHVWTANQLKHISHYGIWVFISDAGEAPQYEYPNGNDSKGEWSFFTDIIAPHIKATSEGGSGPNNCVYDLEIPGGAQVAIWVGARTPTTNNTGDSGTFVVETNTKGSPSNSNNWSKVGSGSLGRNSFTEEDSGNPVT